MKRKQFRFNWSAWSPQVAVALVFGVLAVSIYCFRLGGFIGPAGGEMQTIDSLNSFARLADNPLLLPYKVLATLFLLAPGESTLMIRIAAVMVSLCNIGLFFILARRWYGLLNGLAATTLFTTSGWLLQTGRYGAGYGALTLMVLGLLNLTVWTNSTEKSGRALIVFSLACGLALFVPGGIWFIAAAAFICRESLLEHFREATTTARAISGATLIAALLVLAAAFANNLPLLKQWAGLPAVFPELIILGKQAVLSVSGLVLRGPFLPDVWLAHTPLLDVGATALLILGIMFYSRHLRNQRTMLLGSFFLLGALLTMLNGAAALSYTLPIVYLVLGSGFAYLLHQWKKVFPRNPIAEGVALTLLGLLIIGIMSFHAQRYFIAWRNSPTTLEAYSHPSRTANPLPYLIQ